MATRREFIKKGTFSFAAGFAAVSLTGIKALAETPGIVSGAKRGLVPLSSVTAETFVPHINSVFNVKPADSNKALEFELLEVRGLPSSASPDQRGSNGFSLLFGGQTDCLRGRMVEISHRAIGTLSVFGTPVLAGGNYFEVVFNKLG